MIGGMSANTEKSTAGRNLLIYAALVAIVAAYTALVWAQRDELEGYRYPTGLRDGDIYDLEADPPDPEKPMAKLDGVAYFAAKAPEGWRDRYMLPWARDDDDRFFFYKPNTEIGGGGEEKGSGVYLKVGKNSYILVNPDGRDPGAMASD